MPKRPAPNFGSAFRRDLDDAASGYTAPGGDPDGSPALGINYDEELRYDIKATATHTPKRKYHPTTRYGRAVYGINRELGSIDGRH